MNFKLPKAEWVSVLKGALVAGGGVALTYLSQNLSGLNFGDSTAIVVGILSVVLNVLRKSLSNVDVKAGE